MAASSTGSHRAFSFHPYLSDDYRKWLELSPWTVHKPLPAGPDRAGLGRWVLLRRTDARRPDPARTLNPFEISDHFPVLPLALLLTATFWSDRGRHLRLSGGRSAWAWLSRLWHSSLVLLRRGDVGLPARLRRALAVAGAVPLAALELLDGRPEQLRDADREAGRPSCGWPHDRLLRDITAAERFHRPSGRGSDQHAAAVGGSSRLEALIPDRQTGSCFRAFRPAFRRSCVLFAAT